ncbi:MAG: hypothetical protein K6F50_08310 [Kiritimatiellae bacterium]|nr:hypothetical protein [Kiritimatiellia bacterium]
MAKSSAINLAVGFLLGCAATFGAMEFFGAGKATEAKSAGTAGPLRTADLPAKGAKSDPPTIPAPADEKPSRKIEAPAEKPQVAEVPAVRERVHESEEEREARLEASLEKLRFLGSIDVNGMGRQERRSHERLQKRLAERDALEDMLESDISDEDRAMVLEEKEKTDAQIDELNRKVRNNLISIVAQNLGVGKSEAKEVVKTIAEIINATE